MLAIVGFTYSQETASLNKMLTLKPTSYSGGNGAGVVWHPKLQRYYTARAGNTSFPLDFFDSFGKKLSSENYTTMFDIRGLWYDKKMNKICMNGYNDFGWGSYKLDDNGIPVSTETILKGMVQPEANSVGCSNSKSEVYFLSSFDIKAYKLKKGKIKSEKKLVTLNGAANHKHSSSYNLALVYTGIKNQEFGLYNYELNEIHLFSKKTGEITKILKLPSSLTGPTVFNFAYTNGIFFIYDKTEGQWLGFK